MREKEREREREGGKKREREGVRESERGEREIWGEQEISLPISKCMLNPSANPFSFIL